MDYYKSKLTFCTIKQSFVKANKFNRFNFLTNPNSIQRENNNIQFYVLSMSMIKIILIQITVDNRTYNFI